MAIYKPKPKGRQMKFLQTDIFEDQFETLAQVAEKTGKTRAQLVREAIDKAYPRKEK